MGGVEPPKVPHEVNGYMNETSYDIVARSAYRRSIEFHEHVRLLSTVSYTRIAG